MKKNNKIVYVAFADDILHKGHFNILKKASSLGKVTVGLLTDKAIATYRTLPYKDYKQRTYKLYNSSLQFNSSGTNFYHKSKLVPGAEQLPYKNYLKFFLNENFLKLAGSTGNLSQSFSI